MVFTRFPYKFIVFVAFHQWTIFATLLSVYKQKSKNNDASRCIVFSSRLSLQTLSLQLGAGPKADEGMNSATGSESWGREGGCLTGWGWVARQTATNGRAGGGPMGKLGACPALLCYATVKFVCPEVPVPCVLPTKHKLTFYVMTLYRLWWFLLWL
jgi:hypothetical protein